MTDDFELSRRKALAALGTIGVASAGAGLGTSAYFSDQETFENNQLTAGTLDMHIGWEEHYSDWSPDEDDGLEGDVTMGNDQPVGLPTQNSSLISVNSTADARQFLNNTETDQLPNDSVTFDDAGGMNGCSVLVDGADQDRVIVDIDDVKPGDFGEVTFAFSLCDNPGYVWMNGGLRNAAENGYTEPELDDPDEDGPNSDETVELLDEVRTALWYDDGDNLQSGGGGAGGEKLDVALVLDDSGSVSSVKQDIKDGAKAFVDILSMTDAGASIAFSGSAEVEYPLTVLDTQTKVDNLKDAIDNFSGPGLGTDITTALNTAQTELNSNDAARPDAQDVIILVSDGQANESSYRAAADTIKSNGTNIGVIGFGSVNTDDLQYIAGTDPNTDSAQGLFVDGSSSSMQSIQDAFDELGQVVVTGEEVFFNGSLRELLNALDPDQASDRNQGIPLEGNIPAEQGGGTGRNCFDGQGVVHYVGFAWWLPVNHGNQVQGDSATFDLGFYTEQCRHNNGEGMNNAAVAANQTDDDAT